MSEPLRSTPADESPAHAERDALIEKLLVAGLDKYFEGRYEQAVNIWTRVAFLERGHGRARAYIERARGALAERQRHAEELLHRGVQAYEADRLDEARDLLTRAVAEGGANETALVFLQRLARLDPDVMPLAPAPPPRPLLNPLVPPAPAVAGASSWMATAAVCVAIVAAIWLAAQPLASWLGERPVSVPVAESRPLAPLPLVRSSELRLIRARGLVEDGRPGEALAVLTEIGAADPLRAEADRLVADLQRQLLTGVPAGNAEGSR
jgi:hypothetical protein